MSNILAIAQKELKSYFASPIAYIVIGLWALLYGYFFAAILHFFVQQSMQMNQFGMQGPQSMNVNQQLIRPLLQNVLILILFLMPMVTMRAYSEEKRSGTIELLLTSPLTDMVTFLESIDVALDRIANVMEMNHERALEREAAEQEEREKADGDIADRRSEVGLQLFLRDSEDVAHWIASPPVAAAASGAGVGTSSVVSDRNTSSRLMRIGRISSSPQPLPTTARARSRRTSRPLSLSTS